VYPTNYDNPIYSDYSVNNFLSSLNQFIHGDSGKK
jgi:hypothetical protein